MDDQRSQDGTAEAGVYRLMQQDTVRALELETFLPYRLNVLATLVSQSLSRLYAARHGIGIPEWRVVATLGQYGTMTAKAIGAHSHMHKTKVSRAVAVLEKRAMVARRANRADMREAFLYLTPDGRAMYEDLTPVAIGFADQLAAALDHHDVVALNRAIDRLTDRALALAGDPIDE